MARPEKTEPLLVCVDADVLIAGLLSRTGASHAILVLGELGLLRLVLPEVAVAEVRRNLAAKLSEAAPLFEEFLRAVPVQIHRPTPHDRERARTGPRACRREGCSDPRRGNRRRRADPRDA